MSQLLPCERGPHVALRVRSHSLRRRAEEVMERATRLREQSVHLLRASGGPDVPGGDDEAREDAETLQWYRIQVRQMLAAGWTSAELADVGITDALLRELGLHAAE